MKPLVFLPSSQLFQSPQLILQWNVTLNANYRTAFVFSFHKEGPSVPSAEGDNTGSRAALITAAAQILQLISLSQGNSGGKRLLDHSPGA